MAQYNLLEVVFCGDYNQYYSYNEGLYHETFPIEWAKTPIIGVSGPNNCKDCNKFGSWNGVFCAYCVNCAKLHADKNDYRGGGVSNYLSRGENADIDDPGAAMNTYLKGVELNSIGDIDFMDSMREDILSINTSKLVDISTIKNSDTLRSCTIKREMRKMAISIEDSVINHIWGLNEDVLYNLHQRLSFIHAELCRL